MVKQGPNLLLCRVVQTLSWWFLVCLVIVVILHNLALGILAQDYRWWLHWHRYNRHVLLLSNRLVDFDLSQNRGFFSLITLKWPDRAYLVRAHELSVR